MRPPFYPLLEEIVILGVIYGSLAWRVCNPAAPEGPRGTPSLSLGPCASTATWHTALQIIRIRCLLACAPDSRGLQRMLPTAVHGCCTCVCLCKVPYTTGQHVRGVYLVANQIDRFVVKALWWLPIDPFQKSLCPAGTKGSKVNPESHVPRTAAPYHTSPSFARARVLA